MKKLALALIGTGLLAQAGMANAAFISGLGDPTSAIAGGTVIDFEPTPLGTYSSLTIGDVTFTADDEHLMIDNTYQSYNQSGVYLDNGTYGDNGFSSLSIDIAGGTDAFAFNWGMAEDEVTWTLAANDATDTLIESYVLPATEDSSAGEFYGISAVGIHSAVLSLDGEYDWVGIDNFTYLADVSVPEPSVLLLMGSGLLGLVIARKSRVSA
jgi:hypothetical protein